MVDPNSLVLLPFNIIRDEQFRGSSLVSHMARRVLEWVGKHEYMQLPVNNHHQGIQT